MDEVEQQALPDAVPDVVEASAGHVGVLTGATEAQIKAWITEVLHSRREVSHLDFKRASDSNDVIKDIVALHNTRGSSFDGHGYLVIGISNDYQVHGLSEKEQHAFPNADKRELHLTTLLENQAHPAPPVRVLELTLDEYPDQLLHVVEVPEYREVWSCIYAEHQKHKGYYVRRGTRSVPPRPTELDAYQRELVHGPVERLRYELEIARNSQIELRGQVDQLFARLDPQGATPAQRLRSVLQTPARALLRDVRSEVTQFQEQHERATRQWQDPQMPFRRLDYPEEAVQLGDAWYRRLQDVMEEQEALTRPLVELLGIVALETDGASPGQALHESLYDAVSELANAVMFVGPGRHAQQFQGVTYGALLAYPSIMLLMAAATTAAAASADHRWASFAQVLHHRRQTPGFQESQQTALASHWGLRYHLDFLHRLFDPTYQYGECADHLVTVMQRPDWLGGLMPTTEKHRIARRGEVLTSLGYVLAALQFGITPPFVMSAWMTYFDAPALLRGTLESLNAQRVGLLTQRQPVAWDGALQLLETQLAAYPGIQALQPAQMWSAIRTWR